MAEADTLTAHVETEALLKSLPSDASIGNRGIGRYFANCYYPTDDVVRGKQCFGTGDTLADAISDMRRQFEQAKAAKAKLRTAAECKTAVLALIREHDAAPAAFRDAVDELDVA